MAFKIPEIVYALGPQLKAFMAVGILLKYFVVTCSNLSEDNAEFRYVPLYIADQVEFRCSFSNFFTRTSHYSNLNFTYEAGYEEDYNSFSTTQKKKLVGYLTIIHRSGGE